MTLDYSKKGIIILSHYRSGGTQLLSILSMILEDINIEHHNCGEIEIQGDSLNFIDTINDRFFNRSDDKFSLHLLNSPLSIHQLYYSGGFKKLNEQYEIINLERNDKINSLLSLALWERFIATGLFADSSLWTPENMLDFHTSLIQSPIPFTEITLGMSDVLYDKNQIYRMVNDKLQSFNTLICLLCKIKEEFILPNLTYEEYEHDPSAIYRKYFPFVSEKCKLAIDNTYKGKIPYPSKNYIEYYDSQTAKALKLWGIEKL
jgi:hypothetical protein